MRFHYNIPLGVPIYGPPKKEIAPLAAAGIAMAGSAALNMFGASQQSGYTKEQQRLQAQLDRDNMAYSQQLNKQYQDYLNQTQYGAQVSGMRNAGLNPAGSSTSVAGMQGSNQLHGAGSAPSGPNMSSLGSDAVQAGLSAASAAKDLEIKDAQKENINADTKLKASQTSNTAADTKIKEWQSSPRYKQLVENGLDAQAAKAWADSELSDQEAIKCMAETQKIGKDMQLTDAQINQVQELTAKTRKEIDAIAKGMDEADVRMAFMRAQRDTEFAKQDELRASAAEHRAGVVEKHANAKLSGAKAKTEGYVQANLESETKLNQIETKIREFKQEVTELSGDAHEQGAILGAKRLVSLINPFSDPF